MSSSWAKGLISLGSVTITVWLACFGLKTLNISSSNRDLCYCRSFQPTPSSAEILLLSLILSQAVSTSPWSSKFSKATKLSENLTWYSSVTCSPCCRVKLWFFFACHLHPLIGGGGNADRYRSAFWMSREANVVKAEVKNYVPHACTRAWLCAEYTRKQSRA
jgi:hypothetical protein